MKRFFLFLTTVLLLSAGLILSVSASGGMAGDLNADDAVDIHDAALLLQYSIFPDHYPVSYAGTLDLDGDGEINIRDVVLLLQYSLFPEDYPIPVPVSAGLKFTSNGDGTCSVKYSNACKDSFVMIPETSPDGDTVTSIGASGFLTCTELKSVTIPDTVTSIGEYAFRRAPFAGRSDGARRKRLP